MKVLGIDVAAKTDPGRVRSNNEDSLAVAEEVGLLVVCDGMGGHSSGEVASRIATETVRDFALKMLGGPRQMLPEGETADDRSARARQLEYIVKSANTMIFEKARAFPRDRGMGTTIVAALVGEDSVSVAHVGDSRLYLLRNGELQLLTEDHSLVMDQVRRGLMTMAEAERSSIQNILTRALGTEPEVQVDVEDHPIFPGDVLLLCSDGLTKHVTEAEIREVLRQERPVLELCDELIRRACEGGGSDNVTVVIARLTAGARPGLKGFFSRLFQ